MAVRQVERDRIDDVPGATAHEVAVALAEVFPEQARRRATAARASSTWSCTAAGAATRDQAVDVLGLDDRLGVRA